MSSNFRNEELVKVQGKQYPLVGGRLRLAHEENKSLSISTNLVSMSDDRIIIQANIKTDKGNFSGFGNASSKRDKMFSNALVELAETRAIARALRFAGYGVEYTGFEEMPSDLDDTTEEKITTTLASKAQLEAIASVAKHNNISSKQLHDIMIETTGKEKGRELTSEDALKLLQVLKNTGNTENSKIS